jgi:hypothetical protein
MSNDSSQPDHDPAKIDPKAAKQSKESTEMDLWDLDFDESADPAQPSPGGSSGLPARRTSESSVSSTKPTERPVSEPLAPQAESVKSNPGPYKPREKAEPKSQHVTNEAAAAESSGEIQRESGEMLDSGARERDNSEDKTGEGAGSSTKQALPPTASFTKIEKISISVLFAALALGATLAVIHFSNEVPTRPLIAEEIDFPVNGQLIEIKAAATYWREPVTTGENADVVRRDTKLIPVLKLSLHSKPCAIRIFFRNEDGTVIGDAITRIVNGDTELTIPATAGFDDIGMHAAYRTGGSQPWVVQILEGPDRAASREKFKTVLETEISSDMR